MDHQLEVLLGKVECHFRRGLCCLCPLYEQIKGAGLELRMNSELSSHKAQETFPTWLIYAWSRPKVWKRAVPTETAHRAETTAPLAPGWHPPREAKT